MKRSLERIFLVITGIVIGCLGSVSVVAVAATTPSDLPVAAIRSIAVALELLTRQYVEVIDAETAASACIDGMVRGIDKDGEYFTADDYKALRAPTVSTGGIGLELKLANGAPVVVANVEGSPAERAQLRAGDVLTHIDGVATRGKRLPASVESLRGKPGSKVVLTVQRGGDAAGHDVVVTREIVGAPQGKVIPLQDGYAYVRFAQFQRDTAAEFVEKIQVLSARRQLKGLVIDLRGNPGGQLGGAIQTASLLLPPGKRITETRGRVPESNIQFLAGSLASGPRELNELAQTLGLREMRLVVLTDGKTAAGAEILASALQDHQRARVVGTGTLGRTSIQQVVDLPDGAAVKMTTAYWMSANGRDIRSVGVTPDVVLDTGTSPTNFGSLPDDVALAKAMALLAEGG